MKSAEKRLEFRPAHYARLVAERLSLTQMDELLASGYYRNGMELCANSVRMMKAEWVSAVMLRVRLEDFVWKKRLRKLLRSNNEKFEIEFRPFRHTSEMEALWQRYKLEVHGWRNVPNLAAHILRGQSVDDFHTWQVSVFHQRRLVAFSVFDRGLRSIASLEAGYDPEFSRNSLGIYTMMLEIDWCQSHGLDFYYPGFFPKNDPMFDYKLRPGNIEYLHVDSGEWRPIWMLGAADWKLDVLAEKHLALQTILNDAKINSCYGFNHCLHLPGALPALLDSNLQVIIPVRHKGLKPLLLFVHWDVLRGAFQLFEGMNLSPILNPDLVTPTRPHHFHSVQQGRYYGSCQRVGDVLLFVQEIKARSLEG